MNENFYCEKNPNGKGHCFHIENPNINIFICCWCGFQIEGNKDIDYRHGPFFNR